MKSFKYISRLIRTKRINHPKGYSQSEVSSLLGYRNGQFISNVERGLCSIPMKRMVDLGQILDISKEEIRLAYMKDCEATLTQYFEEYMAGMEEAKE